MAKNGYQNTDDNTVTIAHLISCISWWEMILSCMS